MGANDEDEGGREDDNKGNGGRTREESNGFGESEGFVQFMVGSGCLLQCD